MAKKLLNPRGYLSWTQVDMWMRSPDRYVRQYFYGEEQHENQAMAYGKKTAQALETGQETGDALLDAVAALLPRYKHSEHEIRATLKTQKGDVELLGVLDTYDPITPRFREYKTGRVKWTQARANKHRQLHHYAALIYLKHNKIPTEVWLDWAETEYGQDGETCFTGHLAAFHVKLGLADILEYLSLVSKVAQQIDAAYRKEIKNLS